MTYPGARGVVGEAVPDRAGHGVGVARRHQPTGHVVVDVVTCTRRVGGDNRLLADAPLRARLAANARELQASPGRVKAADLIERVARTGEPVLR